MMKMFETRFGSTEKVWQDWRNEQVEDIPRVVIATVGSIAVRPDPIPYGDPSEKIAVMVKREPIDIISQGI